ncbi:MAG: hypothetical protein RJA70_4751 [Pseudomonadota bacterium]
MRCSWVLSLFLASCGNGGALPKHADAGDQLLTPGERCLEDATALREPSADAPARLELRHIVVRHAEQKYPEGATRTEEQACLRALDALKQLQAGGDWDGVAAEYSDSPMDRLGAVRQEDLEQSFANAAFALEPNQLSYVVKSNRGFHIILRE